MLKNISNLGTTLKIKEQKSISGGSKSNCSNEVAYCRPECCPSGYCCGGSSNNCILANPSGSNCK